MYIDRPSTTPKKSSTAAGSPLILTGERVQGCSESSMNRGALATVCVLDQELGHGGGRSLSGRLSSGYMVVLDAQDTRKETSSLLRKHTTWCGREVAHQPSSPSTVVPEARMSVGGRARRRELCKSGLNADWRVCPGEAGC